MKLLALLAVIFLWPFMVAAQGISWQQVLDEGSGEILVYWYPNNVSIPESKDVLDGVEQELIYAFVDYLNQQYPVDLKVSLIETSGFDSVIDQVEQGSGGMFGASSISITEERQQRIRFTPPYMPDIAVLVSSAQMPLAHTEDEFKTIFKDAKAVTIENTTLVRALHDLERDQDLKFEYVFVQNSGQILEQIGALNNGFGYIDLPNFMDITGKNQRIQRQYFYPIKLSGLGLIYPSNSDWDEPIHAYFTSEQFDEDRTRIITKYLGEDVEAIFSQLSRSAEIGPYEEIVISTREREMQFKELLEASQRDQEKNARIYLLASVAIIALITVIFYYIQYQNKARTNHLLLEQQRIIEKHNRQLSTLNQEKNDLIEVLAHDLRSPLSQIAGFSRLLSESDQIRPEDQELNGYIMKSSQKMESMISKILDVEAIESGERNLKLEKLDVSSLGAEVISEMQDKARAKDIKIRKGECDDCFVIGDRFYLRQIIENLLSNAIKYSPGGKEVEVSAEVQDQFVCIAVADQGPGIEEDD